MARTGKKSRKAKESELGNSSCSMPWKDVTPQDSIALLSSSREGGFMCLEEIDGEFYSHFNGDSVEAPDDAAEDVDHVSHAEKSVVASSKKLKASRKRKRDDPRKKDGGEVVGPKKLQDGNQKKKRDTEDAQEDEAKKPIEALPGKEHGKNKKKKKERNSQSHDDGAVSIEKIVGNEAGFASAEDGDEIDEQEDTENLNKMLPAWAELRLHWKIMKALAALKFTEPTPIQKACISAAAHQGKDIIGAAETGSGKTLAFVIPILQRLLDEDEKYQISTANHMLSTKASSNSRVRGPLRALILTPTRELALQVCDHFRSAAKYTTIMAVPIVGGISMEKQERLLKQRPQAIVGTPGRLWEFMSAGEKHLVELDSLSFFVLDEADRMVEKGHFQELQSIMSMLPIGKNNMVEGTGDDSLLTSAGDDAKQTIRRQNFVFSATLTLPTGFRNKLKKGRLQVKNKQNNDGSSVASLSEKAGIRPNAAIIDLTSKKIIAGAVQESLIQCREDEKDIYLYYILKLHGQGRAVIFCTSIAAVRHITAILSLLQIQAWPLHAQMQQKQRLKAMDRFRKRENSFLIATDVAARGLDIPNVRTVIHYQLPHSAEVYVHRSGRTARASNDGCSIMFVSPTDQMKYNALCGALSKREGLPVFPINRAYMPAIVKRIELAQKIDVLLRKSSQTKAKDSWFKKNADALGIDIEEFDKKVEESNCPSTRKECLELKKLQQVLNEMLEEPLKPKAFSHRFITGAGISPLVAGQLKDYVNEKMMNKKAKSLKKKNKGQLPIVSHRPRLVIGQETVEPLIAFQAST